MCLDEIIMHSIMRASGRIVSPAAALNTPTRNGDGMSESHYITDHRCSKCGETKPVEQFPLRKSRGNTPSSWCRSCHNKNRRERYPVLHPPKTDNSIFENHFHSDHAKIAGLEFREIPGFPGYGVGSDGTVWSNLQKSGPGLPREFGAVWFALKPDVGDKGHLRVALWKDGSPTRKLVHHIVLETFVGPRPSGMEGCHFPDGDPSNNYVSNLRWDTPQGNWRDRKAHGHARAWSKISAADVIRIHEFGRTGMNLKDIAAAFGISDTQVSNILSGRSWKEYTGACD